MALEIPPDVWQEFMDELDQSLAPWEESIHQFIKDRQAGTTQKSTDLWDDAVEKADWDPELHPRGAHGQFVSSFKAGDIVHDWSAAGKHGHGGKYGRVSEVTPGGVQVNYTTKDPSGYKDTGQFKVHSHEDAEEWLSLSGGGGRVQLTPEENKELGAWFGSSHPYRAEIEKTGSIGPRGRVLLSALSKFPPHVGRIFRSEGHGGPAQKGEIQKGKIWTNKNFASYTWKRGSFKSGSYVYVVKARTARDVSGHPSSLKNEREMIMLPGTHYKVLDVQDKVSKGYGHVTRVFLQELKK